MVLSLKTRLRSTVCIQIGCSDDLRRARSALGLGNLIEWGDGVSRLLCCAAARNFCSYFLRVSSWCWRFFIAFGRMQGMPLRTGGDRLALVEGEMEAAALEDAVEVDEAPGRDRLLEDGEEKELGNEDGEEERLAAERQGLLVSSRADEVDSSQELSNLSLELDEPCSSDPCVVEVEGVPLDSGLFESAPLPLWSVFFLLGICSWCGGVLRLDAGRRTGGVARACDMSHLNNLGFLLKMTSLSPTCDKMLTFLISESMF